MEYLEWLQQPEISLEDWLQNKTRRTAKKVLIVNRVKDAEHLVDKYVESHGPVSNLNYLNLTAIAKNALEKMYGGTLRVAKNSKGDAASVSDTVSKIKEDKPVFYDQTMAVALVEDLLQVISDEILDFYIPRESICLDTAREVYVMMNQIRMGERKEIPSGDNEEFKDARIRYEHLEKLIDKYEKILIENNAYDKVLMIKTILASGIEYVDAAEFAVLVPQELTALEQKFLYAISEGEAKKIAYLKPFSANVCFARTYGVQNEVEFVLQDILTKKRKMGDVAILYSSTAQENFIRSVLGGVVGKNNTRLPYSFITGCSAATSNFVQLLLKILDWVETNYHDDMDYILQTSGCISFSACKTEEMTMKEFSEAKRQLLAKIIDEIKDIFMPLEGSRYIDLKCVWDDLIKVLKDYKSNKSVDWAEVKVAFENESMHLDKMRQVESLQETLQVLRDELLKLKISQKEETNKISVMKINPRFITDRKYVYVLGLSSADFSEKLVDSPVLSDEQLRLGLAEKEGDQSVYYISYAANREEEKIAKLQDTLATVQGEDAEVTLVYSYFDVLNIRESGPCVFYLEKLEEAGVNLDDVDKFGYTLLSYNQVDDDALMPKMKPEQESEKSQETEADETESKEAQETEESAQTDAEEDDTKDSETEQKLPKKYVSFSASSIQTLLHCPMQYYYQYIKYIQTSQAQEPGTYMWLPANEFGTLVHSVLQVYTESQLQGKTHDKISDECDSAYLEKLVNKLCEETRKNFPCDVEMIYQDNVKLIMERCKKYLDTVHTDLKTPIQDDVYWTVKECEKEFEKKQLDEVELSECDLYTEEGSMPFNLMTDEKWDKCLALSYNGKIDRIDHYLGDDGKEHIRVIDYKSGRRATQVEKLEKNELVQHIIYTKLLTADENVVVEDFYYIFPFDDEMTLRVTYDAEALKDASKAKPLSDTFVEDVRDTVYHALIDQQYSREDSVVIKDQKEDLLSASEEAKLREKICQYCAYRTICKEEVGKEL